MKPAKLWMFLVATWMIVAFLFAPHVLAQTGTPAEMSDPHGDQPFGSYQVSDIDQIGFENGALDVRIPLFIHHGRGFTHQKYWTYTNKNWFPASAPPCDPTVAECPPPDPPVWAYSDNSVIFSHHLRYIDGCGTGHQKQEDADYTYVDEFGTPHVFDVVTSPQTPVQPQCIHLKLVGYSLDGSGMKFDSTTGIITRKDGTQVQGPLYLPHDSNGNFIGSNGDGANTPSIGEIDTLGRDIQHLKGTLPSGTEYEDWISQDMNNNPQTTRIEWQRLPTSTNFGRPDVVESGPSLRLATKIDLPNGLAYQFTYDTGTTPGHYGELVRIDLPAGGYIRYEYGFISQIDGTRGVTKRVVSADGTPASEKFWGYSYPPTAPNSSVVVTDPDLNDTVRKFSTLTPYGTPVEIEAKYYHGAASDTPLKTVTTDYETITVNVGDGDDVSQTVRTLNRPIRVTTTLDNGLVSKVEMGYDPLPDTNGVISYSRSNVTEKREYDYGQNAPGALIRRTTYTYQHNANSNYATANIVDKVLNTTVYDGSGNPVAQTQNAYDGAGLTNTNLGSCQAPSGAPNHDYCAFSTGNQVRGNLTSVSHWKNTDNTWLTTSYTYDDLGNVLSSTDPGLHVTHYSYSDSWSGTSCIGSGVNTYAFITQITNHLNQRTQASYFSCPGLVQSKRDENDVVAGRAGTTFTYDGINRLLTENSADGGQTSFNYHSDTLPITITKTELATPNPSILSSVIYDGLGRTKTTSIDSDPLGA
ncbi:MAG TPA: hypothetical protein VGK24_04545, partial [Candidatus Angelobacter sp.]